LRIFGACRGLWAVGDTDSAMVSDSGDRRVTNHTHRNISEELKVTGCQDALFQSVNMYRESIFKFWP
jgi:hypothetical protein